MRGELLELRDADAARRWARLEVVVEPAPDPPVRSDASWRRWAACAGKPTSWFFPAKGDVVLTRAAIKVCEGCGVRERCREEALTEEAGLSAVEVSGIRGAKTGPQRVAIVRQRRAVSA